MSNILPTEIAKLVRRECLYSGCHEPALEDSDFCSPHDAHERGRAANRQRRHRQKLADAGLCIAGCGRKVPRQRKPDGTVRKRPCPICRKAHSKRMRNARAKACVTGNERAVTGERSGNWRPDYSPDGSEIQRYRGKARRGRLTYEEQLDEDLRDLREAATQLGEAMRNLPQLKLAEVRELPPIQREEARRAAGEPIGRAARILDELAEKYA